MKLKNSLSAVSDMARSLAFYKTALELWVVPDSGLTPEETDARMDVPPDYIRECTK
ncbi:MAG: hypothetical protein HFG05_08955 [Oscillibacter sp.]|nr:hypothetical protein [Oscillibacter sp.]